jgi:hypothetical protein
MSEEPPDAPQKSVLHACVIWLSWLTAAVGLYFFSVGPVVMLFDKQVIPHNPGVANALAVYVRPCQWAYENTPLHTPIGMYLHLWLPDLFDAKGNLLSPTLRRAQPPAP